MWGCCRDSDSGGVVSYHLIYCEMCRYFELGSVGSEFAVERSLGSDRGGFDSYMLIGVCSLGSLA